MIATFFLGLVLGFLVTFFAYFTLIKSERKEEQERERERKAAEEKPTPRKFYIPEEHVAQFYELYCAGSKRSCKYDTHLYKFRTWRFIEECIPEVGIVGSSWKLSLESILHPYVEEVIGYK